MQKLSIFLICITLTACATTPSQPTHSQPQYHNPYCQREYPKPQMSADNLNSPEMTEWANRMLECQKRH